MDGKDDAREVEGVPTWESQFVDDGVQEAETGLVVESLDDLLEGEGVSLGASAFAGSATGALLVSEVKDDCTDHIGVDPSSSIDNLFTLFHLSANIDYKLGISCPCIILQIFSQVHKTQIIIIIAENSWILLYFMK